MANYCDYRFFFLSILLIEYQRFKYITAISPHSFIGHLKKV